MRKLILLSVAMLLASCAQAPRNVPPPQSLLPPILVKPGFVRISAQSHYYADINSVWVDNEHKNLIHFDAVINLTKGPHVYEDLTKYAKSMRQAKVVNCESHELTHLHTDYYSEFWGEGERVSPKKQRERRVMLQRGSSLYILSQVLCVNLYQN
ncbi:surface-adhesin E family protein [Pasteurellaceae bacterium LIM206]|nr:surface-adhesin E family protein [Pasteurellaceae bacterium LIM206]